MGHRNSFQRIGAQGSTSLAIVGPGIRTRDRYNGGTLRGDSAVYFYNYYTTRVKHFAADMDDFSRSF